METLMGIRGKDFVMMAANRLTAFTFNILKNDENDIWPIKDKIMILAIEPNANGIRCVDYIEENISMFSLDTDYTLNVRTATPFITNTCQQALNTNQLNIGNVLIAGYDENEGPELCYMYNTGSTESLNYAILGANGVRCASLMEHYYNNSITQHGARELLKNCIVKLHNDQVNGEVLNFDVAVITKDGITVLEQLTHGIPNLF